MLEYIVHLKEIEMQKTPKACLNLSHKSDLRGTAQAGILLLINQRNLSENPRAYGPRFSTKDFKNRILCISTGDVLTMRFIIYFINAIGSLDNYTYIFIDYNPLLRILGGEIYR